MELFKKKWSSQYYQISLIWFSGDSKFVKKIRKLKIYREIDRYIKYWSFICENKAINILKIK